MQRGGRAARTGRRVISQKWGHSGKGPLEVSVLVGWRGVGRGGWAGGLPWWVPGCVQQRVYVPGTYLGSSLPSLPLLPTRYRLTATSPLQIGDRAVPQRPEAASLRRVSNVLIQR